MEKYIKWRISDYNYRLTSPLCYLIWVSILPVLFTLLYVEVVHAKRKYEKIILINMMKYAAGTKIWLLCTTYILNIKETSKSTQTTIQK